MMLGGGRETKESTIDLSVGIYLMKKRGGFTEAKGHIATVYANDRAKGEAAVKMVQEAYNITAEAAGQVPMVKKTIPSIQMQK